MDVCMVFGLQFLPAVLWAYYSLLSRQVKWGCSKVEAILLAVYNQVRGYRDRSTGVVPPCFHFLIKFVSLKQSVTMKIIYIFKDL